MTDNLTPKQRRFVEEYLIDLNATQAAIRAGYAANAAKVTASRLLTKANIGELLAELQAKRSERTEITADRVLSELAKIGFANMADYMRVGLNGDPCLDFGNLTRDQAAALVEVTVEDFVDGRGDDARDVRRVKFKLADKRAALVDIGRHLGMFVDVNLNINASIDPAELPDHELARIASSGSERAAEKAQRPSKLN